MGGMAWVALWRAFFKQGNVVFCWFLQSYMTSRQSSYWYLLLFEQRIFWYYLGFQVMAILCCAAKNSLSGTATNFSKERNSELVSLPLNGLEQNSKCLLLFFFRGPEFRVVFSSEEWFREFPVPRNSRNSTGTNQLLRLSRLPRNNFFAGNFQPLVFSSLYFEAVFIF